MKWYDTDLGEGVAELPYKKSYIKKRYGVKWKPKKKRVVKRKRVRAKKRKGGILRRVKRLFLK